MNSNLKGKEKKTFITISGKLKTSSWAQAGWSCLIRPTEAEAQWELATHTRKSKPENAFQDFWVFIVVFDWKHGNTNLEGKQQNERML